MNPLRAIARDLVERRLWTVAALLLVVLIAIPVVFLRSSNTTGAGNVFAPAPAAAAAGAPTATTATAPVGHKASGKRPAGKAKALSAAMRDPFTPPPGTGSTATAGAATPATSGGSAPETAPSLAPVLAPSPTTPAARPKGAAPSGRVVADVRFGATTRTSVPRLTPFPSAHLPVALFLGVTGDRTRAAFLLAPSARIGGQGSCRPADDLCNTLILSRGQVATISVPRGDGGWKRYRLSLASLHSGTSTVSGEGRCIMHALGAYEYDGAHGTLGSNDDKTVCRFASPQPAASLPALK